MKIKNHLIRKCLILFCLCFPASLLYAQEATGDETTTPVKEKVKGTFENGVLINNQTAENLGKSSLDFIIQHRFGLIKDDKDLFGMFAPSNIRLGLNYGITKDLAIGIGATKNKRLYDFQAKYTILRQNKKGGTPVTITYFGDVARSALDDENFINQDSVFKGANKLSYFNEIMIARKMNSHLSLQVAGSYSYFNLVETGIEHGYIGVALAGRYKFSPQSSAIVDFSFCTNPWSETTVTTDDNTVTETTIYYPKPNLGIGYELSTGSHQFQIFICNADAIIHQEVGVYNTNDFTNGDIMFGFNITRQWGFR